MINLGAITFGIAPDTRRLSGAVSEIRAFGRQVEAAFANIGTGGAQAARAMARQEAAMTNALIRVQKFQDQLRRANAPEQMYTRSTVALRGLIDQLTRGPRDALAFQRAMERVNATLSNSQRQFKAWQAIQPNANSRGGMSAALDRLAQVSVLTAGPLSGIATRLHTLSSIMERGSIATIAFAAGLAAGTYAFFKLGAAALDTAKKMEIVNNTLTAVSGSAYLAGRDIQYLYGVADRSGSSFDTLAKQFGQIRAAAKGTSLEGKATKDIFEAVTFASSKLGLSTEDTGGVLRAIQQIMSKGTVQAEELRGQLGDRLPGAFQIMADALGVTTQKLDGLLKKGEVGRSSLIKFAEELKKRYNIDVSKPVDTIVAAEGRMATAFQKFTLELDRQIGFSEAYKNTLNALTGGLTFLTNNMHMLGQAIGLVGGALAGLMLPTLLASFTALGVAIWNMARGMAVFSAATLASGLGGLAMLFLRVAGAAGGAYAGMKLMEKVMGDTGPKAVAASNEEIWKFIRAQEKAKYQISDTTNEYAKQVAVMQAANTAKITALTTELDALQGKISSTATSSFPLLEKLLGAAGFKTNDKAGTEERIKAIRLELSKLLGHQAEVDSMAAALAKLFNMPDISNKPDPAKDMGEKTQLALKNAQDTIRETQQMLDLVYQAPAAKEWGKIQVDINKSVEDFRDRLTRAQVPQAEVIRLTNQYAAALRGLKEGEYNVQHLLSSFQMLERGMSKAMDTFADAFIDAAVEGKDMMETLRDTWKRVLADMLKESFKFMVLNPLKNLMFGTNNQMWSPTSNAGSGGFLGSLLSSFTGGGGGAASAMGSGGFVAPYGSPGFPMPIGMPAFAKGGIAKKPSIFGDDGAEAAVPLPDGRRIPVELSGGNNGGGNISLNVPFTVNGGMDEGRMIKMIMASFRSPEFENRVLVAYRKARQGRAI